MNKEISNEVFLLNNLLRKFIESLQDKYSYSSKDYLSLEKMGKLLDGQDFNFIINELNLNDNALKNCLSIMQECIDKIESEYHDVDLTHIKDKATPLLVLLELSEEEETDDYIKIK